MTQPERPQPGWRHDLKVVSVVLVLTIIVLYALLEIFYKVS
jgi:hypothetical protein